MRRMSDQSNIQSDPTGLKRTAVVDAPSLAAVLGDWSNGADPLNEQLASAVARAIELGDLPAGTRLPAERELSSELGLSRTTIVSAYDRLRTAGLVRSRQGSGTRVASRRPGLTRAYLDDDAIEGGAGGTYSGVGTPSGYPVGLLAAEPEDAVKLTIGAMPAAAAVASAVSQAIREDLPALLEHDGYDPFGWLPLREAIAAHLERLGIPTDPDEVLVTSGAQQAIDLIASRFGGPGATVALENPTYIGAIDAFRASGWRLVSIPVDADGARPEVLGLVAAGGPVHMAYVIPTYHNPTGAVMPGARRREFARVAREAGIRIVEDLTPDASLGRGTPPPFAALDPGSDTLTVGSLSKIAWGGLRIGWVRGRRDDIEHLIAGKIVADHGTSLIMQAMATHVFERIESAAADSRGRATEQRDLVVQLLRDHIPDWSFTVPQGGLSLWVRLPGADANAFCRVAALHGVVVRPGPLASPDGTAREYIRIAYGAPPDRLVEGVMRLASAWAEYAPVARPARSSLAISV